MEERIKKLRELSARMVRCDQLYMDVADALRGVAQALEILTREVQVLNPGWNGE